MELNRGKIIFWNGSFGFIDDLIGGSVFFHRNDLIDKNLHLLDLVTFTIEFSDRKEHIGKKIAKNIKLVGEKVDLNEYNRFVGILQQWDGRHGIVKSTQQAKPIQFYITRRFHLDDKFENEDLLVFCPVKSTKHFDELFALFAYKIDKEKNIKFLQQQYLDSGIEGINEYLTSLKEKLSTKEKFEIDISTIPFVENNNSYTLLIDKINEYKKLGFKPSLELIRNHCNDVFLIQLFESKIIDFYDLDLMMSYFHKTHADNKRYLISIINTADKNHIIEYHINQLRQEGKLSFLNDSIKTLLDIVFRNETSRNDEIYNALKIEILNQLNPKDIIDLWLNGYLDQLSEAFILNHFDIDNEAWVNCLLKNKNPKYKESLNKIFENYFFSFRNRDFSIEFPFLIKRLRHFEKVYKDRYEEIIVTLSTILDEHQKFILCIFGAAISNFDEHTFFYKNYDSLNNYYKIKYLLKSSKAKCIKEIPNYLNEIDFYDGLITYVRTIPWNDLIYPTGIFDSENLKSDFLFDVTKFCLLYNKNINLIGLGNEIFETMPKYNAHHIRLWLFDHIDHEKYDYIGFRSSFKDLTIEEQKIFKEKGNTYYKEKEIYKGSFDVKPCTLILEETNSYKIYSARLNNFFFEKDKLRLRKEDGGYTHIYREIFSSYGFNNIPEKDPLNSFPIEVTIISNIIENITGLDVIFQKIHTNQIKEALGNVGGPRSVQNINIAFVEDWNLKNQVKEYLFENEDPEIEVKLVYEPKNILRRLDTHSGIDILELTGLFTHRLSEDLVIIWENLDYSEDRATYVFKSYKENFDFQLTKIIEAITTLAQLRSTLVSEIDDSMLHIFKANLGFVGKIHKKRGDNLSFTKWYSKLSELMLKPVPEIPSIEKQNELIYWSPKIEHSSRVHPIFDSVKRVPRKMLQDEILTMDIQIKDNIPNDQPIDKYMIRKTKVFNALKIFNTEIKELLNTI